MLPPVTPSTCQVTAVLLVFWTVAVNCCWPPTLTDGKSGDMVTVIAGRIVTVVEADLVESAWDTAVTVTVAGVGTLAGAVYIPEVEIVPVVELPPVTPSTCQVTAVLLVFWTVAVNCCWPPTFTLGDCGEMLTAMAC